MSLFDRLGGQPRQMNPQQMLQQLQRDPVSILRQRGISVPDGMTNPQQIINHLLQTNQINNPRLQALNQMAFRLFGK